MQVHQKVEVRQGRVYPSAELPRRTGVDQEGSPNKGRPPAGESPVIRGDKHDSAAVVVVDRSV